MYFDNKGYNGFKMIISYEKIKTLPVYELKNNSKLGDIAETIFKKNDLRLAGLILKKHNILTKDDFVVTDLDVLEISNSGVIVQNSDSVALASELVRLNNLIKGGYIGGGQKVETRSGKYIGRVCNFLINTQTLDVTRFYTKNLLTEKIFSRQSVLSFEGRVIVVKDEYDMAKIKATAAESIPI